MTDWFPSSPIWLLSQRSLKGINENDLMKIGKDGDYRLIHKAKGHFEGNANSRGALCINVGKDDAFGICSSNENGPGQNALLEVKGGNGDLFVKGSLGIGISKPEAKLQVEGDIKALEAKISSLSISKNNIELNIFINEDRLVICASDMGIMAKHIEGIALNVLGGVDCWTIKASRIAIGLQGKDPSELLHVNGSAIIEGSLKVNGSCNIFDLTVSDCYIRSSHDREGFYVGDAIRKLNAKVMALEEKIS